MCAVDVSTLRLLSLENSAEESVFVRITEVLSEMQAVDAQVVLESAATHLGSDMLSTLKAECTPNPRKASV